MKEETLMTRIMDGIDKINDRLREVGERTVRVEDTVKRHDEVTFPEMKSELKVQSDALFRMESKQKEDMKAFVFEKEKMYQEFNKRLTPLESDLKKRSDFTDGVKKKGWDAIWDWAKIGIVFVAGYLLTLIKNIK